VIIFSILGFSPWSNAFLFAFTIPNLFRRLLGEGALTSAMIPIYGEALQRGEATAHHFLNGILSRLCLLFLGMIAIVLISVLLFWIILTQHWRRALGLSVVLSPYLACSCIAAMLCAALNVRHSFAIPALNASWLNLSILILGLLPILMGNESLLYGALILSFGVLLGGFLQIAFPWIFLHRSGWKFHFSFQENEWTKCMWKLFLPAVMGAAAMQINGAICRILAYCFTNNGLPALYLSSRLVELPLGIFTVSIATVAFPQLSQAMARNNGDEFFYHYRRFQWATAMIAIPCSIGLIFLGKSVLSLFFRWGNFSAAHVAETIPVLIIAALAIPFLSFSSIATRAFHAQRNMETPLRIAIITIFSNVIGAVLFLKPYGVVGIVVTNTSTACLQSLFLHIALRKNGTGDPQIHRRWISLTTASLSLLLCLGSIHWFAAKNIFPIPPKCGALAEIILSLFIGGGAYVITLHWFRFSEISLLFSFFRIFGDKKARQ
jgi:putative peptidoglycan lipid II flippase